MKKKPCASRKKSSTKLNRTRAVRPAIKGLNVKLLRKVRKHILKEPRRLNMYVFATPQPCAPCGTAGCIAGWAALLSGKSTHDARIKNPGLAARLLRIPDKPWYGSPANILFYVDNWPERFGREYDAASDYETRAKVTARRIDYFIKEGK